VSRNYALLTAATSYGDIVVATHSRQFPNYLTFQPLTALCHHDVGCRRPRSPTGCRCLKVPAHNAPRTVHPGPLSQFRDFPRGNRDHHFAFSTTSVILSYSRYSIDFRRAATFADCLARPREVVAPPVAGTYRVGFQGADRRAPPGHATGGADGRGLGPSHWVGPRAVS
jgi:hypothetical protein